MILTENLLLLVIFGVVFLIVSIALFFMEKDRPKKIKPRITLKNTLASIFFGLLIAWLAWLIIHGGNIIAKN